MKSIQLVTLVLIACVSLTLVALSSVMWPALLFTEGDDATTAIGYIYLVVFVVATITTVVTLRRVFRIA